MKISNQLLRDEKANLDAFLTREIARAAARNVNEFIIKGTGSSQPYGVLTRATQYETLASVSGLDFSDVINLEAAIPNAYLQENECGWVLRGTTLNAIRGLTGNIPQAGLLNVTRNSIDAYPLANSDFIAALGTGNKPIIFGNWGYYMFVESVDMEIARNPYVYMANGQTGIFVTMRWGGDVTQAEAFAYGVNP
jgi:HK97 family phage major capsid protein